MSNFAIREAIQADTPLIMNSWLKSFRTAKSAGMVAMDDWDVVMRRAISQVLLRDGVEVLVAHRPGVATGADIYGWLAYEREYQVPAGKGVMRAGGCPLVHYVYVRQPYRRMGVASGLMRRAGLSLADRFRYTCRTAVIARNERKIPCATWEPLIARFRKVAA